MARNIFWVFVTILIGCGAVSRDGPIHFPETIRVEWRVSSEREIAAENVPPGVQDLGLRRAARAAYEGPAALTVVVYEMTADASAFELVQRWQPMVGSIAFHVGELFVILEAPELDNASLSGIAAELESLWQN